MQNSGQRRRPPTEQEATAALLGAIAGAVAIPASALPPELRHALEEHAGIHDKRIPEELYRRGMESSDLTADEKFVLRMTKLSEDFADKDDTAESIKAAIMAVASGDPNVERANTMLTLYGIPHGACDVLRDKARNDRFRAKMAALEVLTRSADSECKCVMCRLKAVATGGEACERRPGHGEPTPSQASGAAKAEEARRSNN